MNEKVIRTIVDTVINEMNTLTLNKACLLSEAIRKRAGEMGVNAVVAISDSGARPILVECMDGAYIASYDIALNKAFTSVSLKMSTKTLKPLAQPGGSLYGIQHTNEGKIVIFGGGETLCDKNGRIIGGLGVSGGSEAQDTTLAEYGKQIFEKGII